MNRWISKLFFYECWSVAWRILEDPSSAYPDDSGTACYRKLDTGRNYWSADPFLFCHEGKTYLFFESMRLHSNKAAIACCELSENGSSRITDVLKTDGHLSYPAVFRSENGIFMIPETLDTGCISLYRAVSFPFRWEKAGDLISDFNAVDCTPVSNNEKTGLFLYDPDEPNHRLRKLYYADLDCGACSLGNLRLLSEYPEKTGRPAGNVFPDSAGNQIRPTQDCRKLYGGSIRYMKYHMNGNTFSEDETAVLSPGSVICPGLPGTALGVHTVNRCGKYEAVDLFYRRFSIIKPLRALWRRLCK